ncbi:MAG: type III-A CRISPR-associated protein Csm2 [Oscillochloridaceae bacterium umkhey_bin13]
MTQDRGPRPGNPATTPVPDQATLEQIIAKGNVQELVTWAEQLGRGLALAERLTSSQVRGFFGAVRQIQAEADANAAQEQHKRELDAGKHLSEGVHRKLILLKPRLAYQAERDRENRKGEGVKRLAQVLTPAIDLVGHDRKRFTRFVEFFEAILAYHKAAGGREQ